jgi:hypothetical protein
MEVGNVELRCAARTNRSDCLSLDDTRSTPNRERAQVRERDGVTVTGSNAERDSVPGRRTGERDDACRGSVHGRVEDTRDVDAAVLSGAVRVGRVERERPQNGAVCRPRPRKRGYRADEGEQGDGKQGEPQQNLLVVKIENERAP